jgi:cell division septation protein DedD
VPPPAGNEPLALVPQADGDAATRPPARARTALAHPAAPGGSARPAAPATGGGYAVQVSSQRSEAEAQAAFKALQAKFPTQLGSREAVVRRADLGSKGVYYRALVGPFGSMDEAAGMCSSLKAAGGSCLVQRN